MQPYTDQHNPKITASTRYVTPLARAVFAAVLVTAAPAQASSVSYFQDQSNHLQDGTEYLKVAINDEGIDSTSHFQNIMSGMNKHGFGETEHGRTEKKWGGQEPLHSPHGKNDNDNNEGSFHYTTPYEGGHGDFVLRKHGRRHDDQHDIWERGEHCDLPPPAPTPSAVPLPASAWLFGSGLLGLVAIARRKTRSL